MGRPSINPLPTTVPGKGSGSPTGEAKEPAAPAGGSLPKQEDKEPTQEQAKNAVTDETLQSRIDRSRMIEDLDTKVVALDRKVELRLLELIKQRVEGLGRYEKEQPLEIADKLLKKVYEDAAARQKKIEGLGNKATGSERIFLTEQEVAVVLTGLERDIIQFAASLGESVKLEGYETYQTQDGRLIRASQAIMGILRKTGVQLGDIDPTLLAKGEVAIEKPLHQRIVANEYVQSKFVGQNADVQTKLLLDLEYARFALYESLGLDIGKAENLQNLSLGTDILDPTRDLRRGRTNLTLHNLKARQVEKILEREYGGKQLTNLSDAEQIEIELRAGQAGLEDYCDEMVNGILKESKGEALRTNQLDVLQGMAKTVEGVKLLSPAELAQLNQDKAAAEATKTSISDAITTIGNIEKTTEDGLMKKANTTLDNADKALHSFARNPTNEERNIRNRLRQARAQHTRYSNEVQRLQQIIDHIPGGPRNPDYQPKLAEKTTSAIAMQQWENIKNSEEAALTRLQKLVENFNIAQSHRDRLTQELADAKALAGITPEDRAKKLSEATFTFDKLSKLLSDDLAARSQAPPDKVKENPVLMKIYHMVKDDYDGIMEAGTGLGKNKRVEIADLADAANTEIAYETWLKMFFEQNTDTQHSLSRQEQRKILTAYELAREISRYTGKQIKATDAAGNPIANTDQHYSLARKGIEDATKALKDLEDTGAPKPAIDTAKQNLKDLEDLYWKFQFSALKSVLPEVSKLTRPADMALLNRQILNHRYEAALSGNAYAESVYEARVKPPVRIEEVAVTNIGKAEIKEDGIIDYDINALGLGGHVHVEFVLDQNTHEVNFQMTVDKTQELLNALPPTRQEALDQHWPFALYNQFYGPDLTSPKILNAVNGERELVYSSDSVAGPGVNFEDAITKIAGPNVLTGPDVEPYVALHELIPAAITDSLISSGNQKRIDLLSGFSAPITFEGAVYNVNLSADGTMTIGNATAGYFELKSFLQTYPEKLRTRLHPDPKNRLTGPERDDLVQNLVTLKADIGKAALELMRQKGF